MSPSNPDHDAPPMQAVRTGPDAVRIRTPAKLNLFLEVLGKRADGFHELDMILEAIDLCDTLVAARSSGGITLETNAPGIPTGSDNIIVKAAHRFFEHCGIPPQVCFFLQKRIPAGGGLGGGSSNAIGALYALMALFQVRLPHDVLLSMASALGSDVPFFLRGGLARCRGRGEIVETLGAGSPRRYVLITPRFALSTAEVYANITFPLTSQRILGSMTCETVDRLAASGELFFNRLEEPAFTLQPELHEIREGARRGGVSALLTGSGSCLFGLVREERDVDALAGSLGAAERGVAVTVSRNLPPWSIPAETPSDR